MEPNGTGDATPAAGMTNEAFSPRETLDRALRTWWLVALMMVLGAGVGWGVHRMQPPVYEAKAAISVSIDFTHTGALTDVEEDYAIGVVGDVIGSSAVMDAAAVAAQQEGYAAAGLAQNAYLERYNNVWTLRVRDPNPQAAAGLANQWAQAAYSTLSDAHSHALAADRLIRLQNSLQSCLEQSVASGPVQAVCALNNLDTIQADLADMGATLQQEQLASQGILAYTSFALTGKAEPPASPAIYHQGQMMLAGALIGLVLAVWGIYLQIPARLARRKVRYA